jgi:TetR/AcrR family transcriptional repressor of nem operon
MFSIEHRDNLGNGCPMTASASEIARQGPAVATSFARAFKEKVISLEASIKEKMPASEKRQLAVSALAAQIGAMAVSRAVVKVDASLSKEVLQTVRKSLKFARTFKGNKAKRSQPARLTR